MSTGFHLFADAGSSGVSDYWIERQDQVEKPRLYGAQHFAHQSILSQLTIVFQISRRLKLAQLLGYRQKSVSGGLSFECNGSEV